MESLTGKKVDSSLIETNNMLRFYEWSFFDLLNVLKKEKFDNSSTYKQLYALVLDLRGLRQTILSWFKGDNIEQILKMYKDEYIYFKEKVDLLLNKKLENTKNNIWNVVSIADYKKRIWIYEQAIIDTREKEQARERRQKLLKFFYSSTQGNFLTLREQNLVRDKVDDLMESTKWQSDAKNDANYKKDIMSLRVSKVPDLFLGKWLSVPHVEWIRKFLNDDTVSRVEKAQVSHDLRKVYWNRALNDAIYLEAWSEVQAFSPEFDTFVINKISPNIAWKKNYARLEVTQKKKWSNFIEKKVYFTDLSEFVRWTKIKLHNHDGLYVEMLSLIDFKKSKTSLEKNEQKNESFFWKVKNKVKSFFKNIF